jgi:hypothetical protein
MRLPALRVTPFAYAIVGLLLLASAGLHAFPNDVDGIVGWASTNVANLTDHPIAATLASAFVVPSGLLPELLIVAVSFAVVERAIGTLRVVVIALSGHILATVLTEGGVALGIAVGALPATDATRSDVGISYAMYAVLAASVLLLAGPLRYVALAAILALVVVPVLIAPDMTAMGHLLSVAIGLGLMWRLRAGAYREYVAESRTVYCGCGAPYSVVVEFPYRTGDNPDDPRMTIESSARCPYRVLVGHVVLSDDEVLSQLGSPR